MNAATLIATLSATVFFLLWITAVLDRRRAADRATRELRIALRYIGEKKPTLYDIFVERYLDGDLAKIAQLFPNFSRFRIEALRREQEFDHE